MTVFSVLRPSLQRTVGAAVLSYVRKNPQLFLSSKNVQQVMVRTHVWEIETSMKVRPGKYETNVFWDQLHYYFMLGLIPVFLVVFYANVFIGPAELVDTPEGYHPKDYEYIKGPIERFFAKYCYDGYQKEYERNLHILKYQQDLRDFRMLEKKIRHLQSTRQDYKGWYFVPANLNRVEFIRKSKEDLENKR